jgi:hypothetical protein
MLIQERRLNVEKSDTIVESNFRIKASAKAFRILSSGLYSDRMRAIIRELSTNCSDSHVMAGVANKPFKVHLPNRLEPFFACRDFGTGLSPYDIENIYTTYFESNKTNSNDVTGCLGLGSKSPFSYTDNFTVISWFNGKKYSYTAFINEHGMPSIAKLGEEDSDESNGLEVNFPVEAKDFFTFKDKARAVYQYFKVRPEIVGETVEFDNKQPDYARSNWKLFRGTQYGNYLIMGNVAYPINFGELDERHSLFNSVAIHVYCEIGEAEMTASRESLEYTELTKNTIQKAVDEAVELWEELVSEDLKNQKTFWEACLFYKQNQLWLNHVTQWNGRRLVHDIKLTKPASCQVFRATYRGKIRPENERKLESVSVKSKPCFFENDLPRGAKQRVVKYLYTNKAISSGDNAFLFSFADAVERKAFFDDLGLPDNILIKASSLPKIVRNPSSNTGKKVVYKFDRQQNKMMNYWDTVEFKDVEQTGGIYVMLDGWHIVGMSNSYNHGGGDDLARIASDLYYAGYTTPIYGIRKNVYKKIKGNTKWVTLQEKLAEIKKEHEADLEFIKHEGSYLKYNNLVLLKKKGVNLDVDKLVQGIERINKNNYKYGYLHRLLTDYTQDVSFSLTDMLNNLKNRYPLVFVISENVESGKWPIDSLVNYVKMVDSGNQDAFQG